MSYDLESDLLRAACELCSRRDHDAFTLAALRDFIASTAPKFSRLVHPLLAHLVEPLAERLVNDGLLARAEGGYVLTEEGHVYLRRSPHYLRTPE
jgi:hypothetical protein